MAKYTIEGTGWPTTEKDDLDAIWISATDLWDNCTPPMTLRKPDGSTETFNTLDQLETFIEENR